MYWHLASIPIVLQRVVLKCSVKQHFALWKITIYNSAFSRQLSQQKQIIGPSVFNIFDLFSATEYMKSWEYSF